MKIQTLAELAATLREAGEEARRALARKRLIDFVQYTFREYHARRVHYHIAEKLEAVARGDLLRLIICMPPQYGKSELASIRFPAWYLGANPDKRIILCSYGAHLAQAFSRQVRNLLQSTEYQELFGPQRIKRQPVELAKDSRAVDAWNLAHHRGGLIAAGVGSGITGHGADLAIIDDPLKDDKEARSVRVRETLRSWYQGVLYARLSPDAAVVVINTRWHRDDLTGFLLGQEDGDEWTVVNLPALAGADDELGRAPGEPLIPERHTPTQLEKIKRVVGPRLWASVWQQKPPNESGEMVKRSWFKMLNEVPAGIRWVRYWDFAFTAKQLSSLDPDWTVGVKIGLWTLAKDDVRIVVAQVTDIQANWPDAKRHIIATAQVDGRDVQIVGEQVGAQKAAIADLQIAPEMQGYSVRGQVPRGDKVGRAQPFCDRAQAGFVYLVRGAWNARYLDWLEGFPTAVHDDHMDATSGGYIALTRGGSFRSVMA